MKCVLFALIAAAAATDVAITTHLHADNPNTAFYTYLGDVLPETNSDGWDSSYAVVHKGNGTEEDPNAELSTWNTTIGSTLYNNGVLATGNVDLDYHVGNRFIELDFCFGATADATDGVTLTVTGTEYADGSTRQLYTGTWTSGDALCTPGHGLDSSVQGLVIGGLSKLKFEATTTAGSPLPDGCTLAIVDGTLLEDPMVDCVEVSKEVPGINSVGATDDETHKSWYQQHGFHINGSRFATGVFAAKANSNLVYEPASPDHDYTFVSGYVGQDDSAQTCDISGVSYQVWVTYGDSAEAKVWDSADVSVSSENGAYHFNESFTNGQVLQLKTIGGSDCTKTAWVDTHYCTSFFSDAVDCVWGDWAVTATDNDNNCDVACGAGVVEETRVHTTEARRGGNVCTGPNYNFTSCEFEGCSTDCVMGDWTTVIECSKSCGTGNKTKFRSVAIPALHNGTCNEDTTEVTSCDNAELCPGDCQVSPWTTWKTNDNAETPASFNATTNEHADKSCRDDDTTLIRTRDILSNTTNGGRACPALNETRLVHSARCPIDCEVNVTVGLTDADGWINHGVCTATCGTGAQVQRRTVIHPQFGGEACGNTERFEQCNQQACPVDCVLGVWSTWSGNGTSGPPCDRTCGPGNQHRHRIVERDLGNDGICSDDSSGTVVNHTDISSVTLHETQACTTDSAPEWVADCPGDCIVTRFSPWSLCDATCGNKGVSAVRSRSVHEQATNGGMLCPHLEETRPCGNDEKECCPEDVVYGTWQPWGDCMRDGAVVTCGGANATTTRVRDIETNATCGGVESSADLMTEEEPCMEAKCPEDCQVGAWSAWGDCSANCNNGVSPVQSRSRIVTTDTLWGGNQCPALEGEQVCATENATACPVDCIEGVWSDWSVCDATCYAKWAGGECSGTNLIEQRRVRSHTPAENGGICEDSSGNDITNDVTDSQLCTTIPACPVAATAGDWGGWGACSESCGEGIAERNRTISNRDAAICTSGSTSAPLDVETRTCTGNNCAQSCLYSPWSAPECDQACKPASGSEGNLTQSRSVLRFGYNNTNNVWDNCDDRTQRVGTCNNQPCPIHCTAGTDTGTFTECSATCGTGFRTALLAGGNAGQHGGDNACDTVGAVSTCNVQACPVDCILGAWGNWGGFAESCVPVNGNTVPVQVRERSILRDATDGGYCNSTADGLTESRVAVGMPDCPVDCSSVYGTWEAWSDCDVPCGGQDCGSGSNYTDCVPTGQQARTRTGTDACKGTDESRACNHQQCPIDCVSGPWSAWGACQKDGVTHSCKRGDFKQLRTRSVVTIGQFGGDDTCSLQANTEDEQDCTDVEDCKDAAVMGAWSGFGSCTGACGAGSKSRTRTCNPTGFQTVCSSTIDFEACVSKCDCEVSAKMSDGRGCFHTDQWGNYKRTTCSYDQINTAFSESTETFVWKVTQVPNAEAGAVDCATALTNAGATGHTDLSPSTLFVGAAIATKTEPCNTDTKCPVDCQYSAGSPGLWQNDGICENPTTNEPCGSNTKQVRKRQISTHSRDGGASCESESASTIDGDWEKVSVDCHAGPCARNCTLGAWAEWSACSATCGVEAFKVDRRPILTIAAHGGTCEETVSTTTNCSGNPTCPTNCTMSAVGAWGECSLACGGGQKTRSRTVLEDATGTADACPTQLEFTESCNVHLCNYSTPTDNSTLDATDPPTLAPTKALENATDTPSPTRMPTQPQAGTDEGAVTCDGSYFAEDAATVAVGFVGRGRKSGAHNVDNSCNLCKCYAGGHIGCQNRKCTQDYADHAVHPEYQKEYKTCSSTTCKFEYMQTSSCANTNHRDANGDIIASSNATTNGDCFAKPTTDRAEVKFLKTIHGGSETNGNHHFCAYNLHESRCECRCWDSGATTLTARTNNLFDQSTGDSTIDALRT